jgi:hypothetical protein
MPDLPIWNHLSHMIWIPKIAFQIQMVKQNNVKRQFVSQCFLYTYVEFTFCIQLQISI